MVQWSLFAATSVEPAALTIQSSKPETEDGRATIQVSARTLKRSFDVLEKHFAETDYIVGDRFTAADINVAEIIRYARSCASLFDGRPALSAWYERCTTRPAYQAMWAKRGAEPA